MKIAVFGGSGRAGHVIVEEAIARGHQVTAIVRDEATARRRLAPDVPLLVKAPQDVTTADLAGFDAVVDALSVPWGSGLGYLHLDFAKHIIEILANTPTLAVFILGSASLKMPGDSQPMFEEFPPEASQAPWYDGANFQYQEWQFLETVTNVNWIGVSPSEAFPTGPKTGYVMGTDTLLADDQGQSQISTGNMAAAILDELEHPQHIKQRFTVRDK